LLSDLFHPAIAGVFFDRLHTEKQFQYAQEWVRLLNLYFAGDTGYIDTLPKPASMQLIVSWLLTTATF
jgi:hypothetical protein